MVKNGFLAALLLVLLAVGWRFAGGGRLDAWLHPKREIAKPIEFDNGTVRKLELPQQAGSGPNAPSAAIGRPRKCKVGETVTYTDVPCPKGAKEHAIGGTMTVLDGPPRPKPAPGALPLPGEKRRTTVLESLDDSGNLGLHNKRIERAVNPQ